MPPQGGLFASDFLQDAVAELPAWKDWTATALADLETRLKQALDTFPTDSNPNAPPNETVTETDLIWPVLEALGWNASLRNQNMSRRGREDVPDGILFDGPNTKRRAYRFAHEWERYRLASVIVESKRWLRPLDRSSGQPGEAETPSTQMLRYLRRADNLTDGKLRWGVLTNGAVWRLYDYQAPSVTDDFLQVDLRELWHHGEPALQGTEEPENTAKQLRLFATMFGRRSFLTDAATGHTFHQQAIQRSESYRAHITESLSRKIFEQAYPRLVNAIGDQCGSDSLSDIRDAALVFLYRLLFLLYAEDRGLLPVQDDRYAEYAVRDKVRNDIGKGKDEHRTFSTSAARYWSTISDLSNCIDQGDESIGLPPYNGGLFDRSHTPILNRIQLSDAVVADIIDALAFDHTSGQRRYVNFRDLGVQHLGSVYEGLLEQELVRDGSTITVRPNTFARKLSGSYYTPDALVSLIIRETVGPLVDAREETFTQEAAKQVSAEDLAKVDAAERILELRVCDPAMGSGHFLVNLVDYLADRILAALAEADTVQSYVSPLATRICAIRQTILENAEANNWTLDRERLDDRHIVRRMILKRCVFGVDKNPMAVELAKVALWLHTFTVGAPLSFLDHHLQCGNSLFGSWIHNADPFAKQGVANILLREPVDSAIGAESIIRSIEQLTDAEIEEAHQSAARFEDARARTRPLEALLSFFCGLRWLHAQRKIDARSIAPLMDGSLGDVRAIALGDLDLPANHKLTAAVNEARAISARESFFHWQTAFPGIWTDWGETTPQGGFDAVIGNPPWERIKLAQIEWFALRDPKVAKAEKAAIRRKLAADLAASGTALAQEFRQAEEQAKGTATMARKCGDYPLLAKGDINLYSLFVERAFQFVEPEGTVGLLVPSGIASDKTAAPFFRSLATTGRLRKLYDFENRRSRYKGPRFFPTVDGRFKFCALIATAKPGSNPADCGFFLHDVSETTDSNRTFAMAAADFGKVNPNTGTAPIFRSRRDADITKRIHDATPVLVDRSMGSPAEQWPVSYVRMYDMANDSGKFHTREEVTDQARAFPVEHGRFEDSEGTWFPLYEGKMVQAFDHRAADVVVRDENLFRPGQQESLGALLKQDPTKLNEPRYYVRIPKEDVDAWLQTNGWNLAFKDITATTNTRTMIAAIIPAAGAGHTLPILRIPTKERDRARKAACMLANLNSLVFDFLARQKVPATHLSWFVVEQIPVIPLKRYASTRFGKKSARDIVCDAVLQLSYTAKDLAPFAADLGHNNSAGRVKPPFAWDPFARSQLASKLDAVFFHLYGIKDPDEVRYIFSTFPNLGPSDTEDGNVQPELNTCLAWIAALTQGKPDADIAT